MVANTIARDYDIARMLEEYRRRIEYLERRVTQLQPVELDTQWVSVSAAPGFTSNLEIRRIGNVVFYKGTLLPNTNWGNANSLQQPVAANAIPAQFRPPESLIYVGGTGATTAATVFRVAVQSNGGVQVRCSTAAHTNSVSVNVSFLAN
jgi:hypothetical protein